MVSNMTPCPPDDVLGALVQHRLADDDAEHVRSHLDECASCAQVVIAAVRGHVVDTGAAPTLALGTPSLPVMEPSKPARVGSRIGRYELRALLGAGGMGHVYEAYDAELDRAIALKVLRPELEVLTERLVRESRLMAKMVHPSVITVHDVGRDGDIVFIAMELIRGETLGSFVRREKRSWRMIVELFERAGAGLAAAHRAGIVHRDFKPDNVLVEVTDEQPTRVIVTDFGIARATSMEEIGGMVTARSSDPRITATGAAIGTPAYMAPEQLDSSRVDHRADVFAFATSLWEALFGARPFPGNSVDEICASMLKPLRAPFSALPFGLVRALERGLALDPAERWQTMDAFVRQLAKQRSRNKRVAIVAGATGLVGAAIAGAVMLARPSIDDPCARATLAFDAGALRGAIADGRVREIVAAKLGTLAAQWRETHHATCNAGSHPVQDPTTAACLDARRTEILGYIDDVIADRGKFALAYGGILGDPTLCTHPPPSLLTAKVPADPALRRRVTAVRYRAFEAEQARDTGDFKKSLALANAVVADAEHTWPMVHAETLYMLSTVQSQGGDTKAAVPTARKAAAIAETSHHDYIAAAAWIQLILSATFDESAPERGLEYATYAEAAIERLGRPSLLLVMYEYAKGAALVQAGRLAEAEAPLRHSVELGETKHPEYLPQAIQGLGFLYEQQGRYADAAVAYRRALAKLPPGTADAPSQITFRERLATCLSQMGQHAEAEREVRRALEIAEQTLPADHLDRAVAHGEVAQILETAGKLDAALVEAHTALASFVKAEGERGEHYGETLRLEATILADLGKYPEAAKRFMRACDITSFQTPDGSTSQADCWLGESGPLFEIGKKQEALALIEKTLAIYFKSYPDPHPQTAQALVTRGQLQGGLHHHDAAVADLERAIAMFDKLALDPGHVAQARWILAKELWQTDATRAHSLLDEAVAALDKAGPAWAQTRADATKWLATNGAKPR